MCKYLVITDEGFRNESYIYEDEIDLGNALKEIGSKVVDILKIESVYNEHENYIKYSKDNYYVGVNNLSEDEWYCTSVDKQYPVYVLASDEADAMIKAIEYVRKEYKGLLVSDYLEVAWVKKQKPLIRKPGKIQFIVEE